MKYEIETYGKKNLFFTSDTNFFHGRIIELCNRPFHSVEEMNEALITNWNRVVPRDGVVFHLGDFAFGGPDEWNSILDRLNGKIHLILGNHDMRMARTEIMERFSEVTLQKIISVDGRKILLDHYPFLCYSGENRGEWQLFGHVHSSEHNDSGADIPRLRHLFRTQYDVGVDNNRFTPLSYGELETIILDSLRPS